MKNSRKIEISLIVESNETLEVLAQDLKQEIACCWNTFEIIYIKEIYTNSKKGDIDETH